MAVLSCAAHLRRKFLTRIYISDEYMEKQVYEANKISTFDWPRIISYEEKYTYEEAKETEAVL